MINKNILFVLLAFLISACTNIENEEIINFNSAPQKNESVSFVKKKLKVFTTAEGKDLRLTETQESLF